jgi:hypothetical protein
VSRMSRGPARVGILRSTLVMRGSTATKAVALARAPPFPGARTTSGRAFPGSLASKNNLVELRGLESLTPHCQHHKIEFVADRPDPEIPESRVSGA